MKTTVRVAATIASAAVLATAAAKASSWDTYGEASAYALTYEPGFAQIEIRSADHYACNGSPVACMPPAADPYAPPFTYTHSDTQTFVRLAANAAGYVTGLGPYTGPTSGQSYTYADLARGKVQISTDASSVAGSLFTEGSGVAGTYADAAFMDTLHFAVAVPTPITVKLHVDGDYSGTVQPVFDFALSDATAVLGTEGTWADGSHSYVGLDGFDTTYIAYATYGRWSAYGPEDFVGTFTVDPRYPDVTVSLGLSAQGTSPSFADFTDDAALSLDLPAGVTFTSDSGAFLTAGTPEPGTWALLVAGFGAVGVAARRRRWTAA